MNMRREAEKQIRRALKELEEEKMEIHIPRDLLGRMDRILDLFDVKTREGLVLCAVRRLLNQYEVLDIRVR